jgi:hypothetical protein
MFICGDEPTGDGKRTMVITYADLLLRAEMQGRTAKLLQNYHGNDDCVWFSHSSNEIRAVDFYPGIFFCGESDAQCKANSMEVFLN